MRPELLKCKKCTTSADCNNDIRGCDKKLKVCKTCALTGFLAGVEACVSGKYKPAATNNPSGTLKRIIPTIQPGETIVPATVTPEADIPVPESPASTIPPTNTSAATNSTAQACISTSWLRERGLNHAAIHHGGVAKVFCVPGLPCATFGHLLRECTGSRECKLVTYLEVCERRSDCIESTTAVSQLSHTFDWSQFRVDGNAGATTLVLTSLSAHPNSGRTSTSRVIASVADHFNSIGLGSICNAVALLPRRLRATFEKEMLIGSTS